MNPFPHVLATSFANEVTAKLDELQIIMVVLFFHRSNNDEKKKEPRRHQKAGSSHETELAVNYEIFSEIFSEIFPEIFSDIFSERTNERTNEGSYFLLIVFLRCWHGSIVFLADFGGFTFRFLMIQHKLKK